MKSQNVARTTALIRLRGNRYRIEERWNQYAGEHGRREDMWGIIDLIEFIPGVGSHGVQVCGSDYAAHWKKITEEHRDDTIYWLSIPNTKLFIYSWRRLKYKRGSKAVRWTPRIVEVVYSDGGFYEVEHEN